VPEPLAMENSKGAIIYYLFFASQNATAEKIAREIVSKHRKHGGQRELAGFSFSRSVFPVTLLGQYGEGRCC